MSFSYWSLAFMMHVRRWWWIMAYCKSLCQTQMELSLVYDIVASTIYLKFKMMNLIEGTILFVYFCSFFFVCFLRGTSWRAKTIGDCRMLNQRGTRIENRLPKLTMHVSNSAFWIDMQVLGPRMEYSRNYRNFRCVCSLFLPSLTGL